MPSPARALELLGELGATPWLVRHHELVLETARMLCDKLWKGKRVDDLEQHVARAIARATRRPAWDVFAKLDAVCEAIAADGV